MPTAVACPKCKTKYSLPDQLLGKPVKCKSCNTMFKVASPTAAATGRSARKPVGSAATAANSAELARMGLDGPIARQPELFGDIPPQQAGNPLGNHVVVDPGFVIASEQPEEKDDKKHDASLIFKNPALETNKQPARSFDPTKKKKRHKITPGGGPGADQIWVLVLAICIAGLLATIVMGYFMNITTASKGYVYVITPTLGIIGIAVSAWWVIKCFQARDSMVDFLMILIPFYIFVYSLKKEKLPWTRSPLIAWMAILVCGILIAVAAWILGIDAQIQKLREAGQF